MSAQEFHIVVRHRQNPIQRFKNDWRDDEWLDAITTTAEIVRLCRETQERHEPVYVHRCGWADIPPTICCSVAVAEVDSKKKRVTFSQQQLLNTPPRYKPGRGESFYFV
jgi:hypothetical protein